MEYGKKIRNVAVLGHQGSGKTTMCESLYSVVYNTEKGSVERKNTISDYLQEEKNRLSSTSSAIVPLEYEGYRFNLIDIPGNDDFIYEALGVTQVIKGAILVISAPNKVQIETIKHFNLLRRKGIPTLIYVNKMDKENINFEDLLSDIQEKLGKDAVPFTYPLGHEDKFDGFVNLISLKARIFDGTKCVDGEIYEDKKAKVFELNNMIRERVALTDDTLLDKFFSGEPLTNEEISTGLRKAVLNAELYPVICGSAAKNIGLHTILEMLIDYLPSPDDLKPYEGLDDQEKVVTRKTVSSEPFSAYVFKTLVDPYLGSISILKICSGKLKLGDEVYCPNIKENVKISSLFYLCGKKQINIDEVFAGDIVAVGKLDNLATGFTLSDKNYHIVYKPVKYPTAVCFKAIELKSKKDEDKFTPALNKLKKEDPCLEVRRNEETKQLLIGGLSETHLQFVFEKLKNNFQIELNTFAPKICYRESIRKTAEGQGRYIKQSGGSGFYGVVSMRFEPSQENQFDEEIFGGAVPKNYFPAVEKGFFEALKQGLLAGFPVIGVKGVLFDGKYHPVDSNELAFKMAAILAFKDAYMKCNPTILEPILKIKVNVDNQYLGDILSDLSSRRAKVMGTDETDHGITEIEALIPESETLDYINRLKSLTQGSGFYNREFYEYEEVPQYLVEKVIKENSLLNKEEK